jgi:enoyl-CoA hydratase/carnithine racemase
MPHVLSQRDGAVATVTLNRPERRNALSRELTGELTQHLRHLAGEAEVRVVILAAAGKAFCSGHDLSEMIGRPLEEYRGLFDACTELMTLIQSLPQPVIAQVQGIATAAGCQLVASCDLAVASVDSAFATPGVKIGLFCITPGVALTRAIGRKRALEMLLTGIAIDAATAAEWGLVNRVVPAADLAAATRELAEQTATASRFTLGFGKQAYYAQCDLDRTSAYASAQEAMSLNAMADDAQEGMAAFLEKRAASWKGR